MLRNFRASSIAFNDPSFPPHKTALLGAALFTGRQGSFYGQQKQTLNYSFRRLLHHNRILNSLGSPSSLSGSTRKKDSDQIFHLFPKFERGSGISTITDRSAPKYKELKNGILYMDVPEGTPHACEEEYRSTKFFLPEKNKKVYIKYKLYDVEGNRIQIMGKEEFCPGFGEAIGDMKQGGRRIIVVPPSLTEGVLKKDYIIYYVIKLSRWEKIISHISGFSIFKPGRRSS